MRLGNCISRSAVDGSLRSGSSYLHAVSVVMQRGGVCECPALLRARRSSDRGHQALLAAAMQCQESLAFTTAGVTCPGKHAVMILLTSLGSWGGGIEEGFLLASSTLGFGGMNIPLAT